MNDPNAPGNQAIHMLTLTCMNAECNFSVRVGRILSRHTFRTGAMVFCPLCGGRAAQSTDNEETYWEALSKSYELPVKIVQALYDVWDSNEHQRFGDFVNQMKKEVEEEYANAR